MVFVLTLNIDQIYMESISIPYCVLESKTLLTIFAKKKRHQDQCFHLNIDQLEIESISIPYCVLESKPLLTIFAKKRENDLCFPLIIDQLLMESKKTIMIYVFP